MLLKKLKKYIGATSGTLKLYKGNKKKIIVCSAKDSSSSQLLEGLEEVKGIALSLRSNLNMFDPFLIVIQ